jgi:hypothetical protein
MYEVMALQVTSLTEGFITNVTGKRPFTAMHALMRLQNASTIK